MYKIRTSEITKMPKSELLTIQISDDNLRLKSEDFSWISDSELAWIVLYTKKLYLKQSSVSSQFL